MAATRSTWSLIQQTNHLKIYFILKTKFVIFFIFSFLLGSFCHSFGTCCSQCNPYKSVLKFSTKVYLKEHISIHTKTTSNTFHCDTCQGTITTRTAFVHHVRGHSKARKEINNNCDKCKRVVILSIIKEELEQL